MSFTESGAGGTAAISYYATVGAQTAVIHHPQNAALLAATPVNDGTNANIYDLSTKGGTVNMNTANCYIVNAAGRYRLPLVYGNAIKNGNPNPSAYTSTESGINVLGNFINHLGNPITDPYIYSNASCTPANATLVWQDEPNLVTNVVLSSDSRFLEFTVNQATIRQGNAVVAVRDASNIVMWSWHIWVTDYVLGTNLKSVRNQTGNTYILLPVDIGWCDGRKENYIGREVKVRFKQQVTAGYTGTTETITVKQKAHEIIYFGNTTFYQWGRKDPFVGLVFGNANKTWYSTSGAASTSNPVTDNFIAGKSCITSGITKPGTFNTNSHMDNVYVNLWSANNVYGSNDNEVTKTVYDPSPIGYKLPPGNVFTGFTLTGTYTTNQSNFNVLMPWNNGWNFYRELNFTGGTVFLGAVGYRYYSAPCLFEVASCHWTARTNSTSSGQYMDFNLSFVRPSFNNNRAYGFSVRPCQE